jgi:thiamine transport system permease protein
VLAHVFFNLPLAIRFFTSALEAATPESLRLAQQLGFDQRSWFRHVEWPLLRPVVSRVSALIYLLCAASFVVVLTLGGPSAATLEVAIYQSLRMDFDVARAFTLSLLQIALCMALIFAAGTTAAPLASVPPLRLHVSSLPRPHLLGIFAVAVSVLVVAPPLLSLAAAGAQAFALRPATMQALLTSLGIALASATFTLVMAYCLSHLLVRQPQLQRGLSLLSLTGLIIPPAVMATGWFDLVSGFASSIALSAFLISTLNMMMALPFSATILGAEMARIQPNHDRLCAQLGLRGWRRLMLIDAPALKRPLAQAFLLAFVLSFGDLTAVLMLGTQGIVTLPSLIASEMGNYRSSTAEGTALLLALLCVLGAFLADRLGGKRDQV